VKGLAVKKKEWFLLQSLMVGISAGLVSSLYRFVIGKGEGVCLWAYGALRTFLAPLSATVSAAAGQGASTASTQAAPAHATSASWAVETASTAAAAGPGPAIPSAGAAWAATAGPYKPLVLLASVVILALLGLAVALLVRHNPMIGGSGIPQVKGIILGFLQDRWFFTLVQKFIGGVLAVAGGLSLGREGPSIQLGACVADGLGGRFASPPAHRRILIASGASAGLAAAFNAPLAGVMFAFEEIYRYLSPVTLLSATVAAVSADYVSKLFFGTGPVFHFTVPTAIPLESYYVLLPLGVITGLCGALYNTVLVRTIRYYGRLWDLAPRRFAFLKPIPVFLLALLVGVCFPVALCGGHEMLSELSVETAIGALLGALAVKFAFSMISFASGAPGGIFFPLLVMGAFIGGIFAKVSIAAWGGSPDLFYNFAVLAMVGMFTSIVRAPITGIILLMEMTGSFSHFLSFTIVAVVSYVVADLCKSTPIYDSLLDNLLEKPGRMRQSEGPTVQIETIVHQGAPAVGKTVQELGLGANCLIIAIKRQSREITPNGSTVICANDQLTLVCNSGDEAAVRAHSLPQFSFEG
jgi:H+/Cl- antiporter ClcA